MQCQAHCRSRRTRSRSEGLVAQDRGGVERFMAAELRSNTINQRPFTRQSSGWDHFITPIHMSRLPAPLHQLDCQPGDEEEYEHEQLEEPDPTVEDYVELVTRDAEQFAV